MNTPKDLRVSASMSPAQPNLIQSAGKNSTAYLAPVLTRRCLLTRRTAAELVSCAGARVDRIAGYYYNFLLSPVDEIWPAGTLWLNKKLEEGSGTKPDWLAAGFILKAVKTATEPSLSGDAST